MITIRHVLSDCCSKAILPVRTKGKITATVCTLCNQKCHIKTTTGYVEMPEEEKRIEKKKLPNLYFEMHDHLRRSGRGEYLK